VRTLLPPPSPCFAAEEREIPLSSEGKRWGQRLTSRALPSPLGKRRKKRKTLWSFSPASVDARRRGRMTVALSPFRPWGGEGKRESG